MTHVKFKNQAPKSFNNLLDDLFPQFPSLLRNEFTFPAGSYSAPVNIKETETGFELDVVAPGFNKEDFSVNVENGLLTIAAEKKAEEEVKNEKQIRSEFKFQSFKRSFTLNEKLDSEKIDAKYVNGVLKIAVQKKAEVKPPVKQITVE